MKVRTEPSPEDVLAVASYVSERAGLSFAGRRGPQLLSAISAAMQRGGSPAGADYLSRLDRDRPEFDELVGRLTVGESYFFREPGHLELLRRQILPERASRDLRRGLRLWSAGCSRGEEPYTQAIILEEAGVAAHARILATDLSTAALGVAEVGVYGPWALRATSERQREAYFHPVGGGHRIHERFRRLVTFRRHNLLDPLGADMRAMDVIFCRNVLIYFEPPAIHRAAQRLASSLAPGGWLVTGSSDPPLEAPDLEPVVTTAGVVYRRAVAHRDPAGKGPTAPRVRDAGPMWSPAGIPRGGSAPTRLSPERTGQAATRPPAQGHEPAGPREAADRVRSLGDTGDIDAAVAAAGLAVEQFPLDVELRFLLAVLLLEAARPAEAAAAARAVVYLEPALVMAHLTLARAEHALDHPEAAHRSLRNAGSLLRALPPDAVVPLSGGEPAGRLSAMVAAHLRATSTDDGEAGGGEAR